MRIINSVFTFPMLPRDELMNNFTMQMKQKSQRKNIIKVENGYIIELDVPGFTKEEIEIYEHDRTLVVNTKKSNDNSREDMTYLFSLDNFKANNVTAKLENGVLTLKLETSEEKVEKKMIEIK